MPLKPVLDFKIKRLANKKQMLTYMCMKVDVSFSLVLNSKLCTVI